jgi:2,3-bisphosphoglycerate-dependent phosphoglycerate mutase
MRFYFIRHGQSENNRLWAETGSWDGRNEDPELTALGRQQAEALAHFLCEPGPVDTAHAWDSQNVGGFAITHLYSSLMVRAVATGTALARALDLPLVAWLDAHEVGGIHHKDVETGTSIGLPGKARSYFEAHYPGLVLPGSLGEEGWWNRPFEEREARPLRARRFLDALLDRHGDTDDCVAVVSHGGFYSYLMRALLNVEPDTGCWFMLNNAAITRIDFDNTAILVHYMNYARFLPADLVT